jgi:CMP-N,N'-diacetyllegionaminic acid synthase
MKIPIGRLAGLIPARKGSTRVKNKNIAMLAGKPLILYTIEAALASNLTQVFLTTDYLPSEMPFDIPNGLQWISRPKEAATDSASYKMYLIHFFNTHPEFDAVMLLQPTCPLRNKDDINKCIEIYLNSVKETLISVIEMGNKNKFYLPNAKSFGKATEIVQGENNNLLYRNSAIYICSKKYFINYNTIYARNGMLFYRMPMARSIDIDIQQDMIYAERFLSYKKGIDYEYDFNVNPIDFDSI